MRKLFFMHIPKCGGTSIKSGLRTSMKGVGGVFSLDNHASKSVSDIFESESLFGFRNKLSAYALASNHYQLVMGHAVFSERLYDEFHDLCDFFTIVRNPVKRFVSHYSYNKFKKSSHFKTNLDLDSFLDSKEAIDVGSFYLRYFSGLENNLSVENAKRNLRKFSLIGDLDKIEMFSRELFSRYNIDLQVGKENENPAAKVVVTDVQMKKIESICSKDIEVYNYMKSEGLIP